MKTIATRSAAHYESRAKIASAMAHPTRLLILDLLQAREHSVSELTEAAGADQSTVSKHLGVLRNAGLVVPRKQGTSTYYRLACDCLAPVFKTLDCVVLVDLDIRKAAAK